jgi:hypothetical protein
MFLNAYTVHDFLHQKNALRPKKPWSEPGFSNILDPDPDTAKCLDPDSVNRYGNTFFNINHRRDSTNQSEKV